MILLIGPFAEDLKSTRHLLVIPYGILQYVPYGILMPSDTQDDFRHLPYLIKTHNIQYAWSIALMQQPLLSATSIEEDYTGFAPRFSAQDTLEVDSIFAYRKDLSALHYNRQEIEQCSQYFSGKLCVDEEATGISFP